MAAFFVGLPAGVSLCKQCKLWVLGRAARDSRLTVKQLFHACRNPLEGRRFLDAD